MYTLASFQFRKCNETYEVQFHPFYYFISLFDLYEENTKNSAHHKAYVSQT